MTFKILFIEDSPDMQQAVASGLCKECEFVFAGTNKEAKEKLDQANFDLVLLDLSLPDGDGFKICNFIRQSEKLRDVPVIFITGRADIDDKEMAFSLGADDYIVKPFDLRDLRARVISRLKRATAAPALVTVGNLKFDLALQRVSVVRESREKPIEMTSLEFRLLLYFARHEDHVFSREQLLNAIWGDGVHLLERTVDTHVSHLRKKLQQNEASFTLRPIHGSGYKFTAVVAHKKSA